MEDSTAAATQALVALATDRAGAIAREQGAWAAGAGRTLEDLGRQTVALAREFGQALLAGVCAVVAAGAAARYVRQRPAQVLPVLGAVSLVRAWYACPQCRHGHAPLDRQLGYCAGSTSAGLEEVLALLDKLTLVRVCPNLARTATARLGRAVQAAEPQAVAAAWGPGTLPAAVAAPPRLQLSMDGALVQTDAGWREYKLGTVYTTATRPSRRHPGQDEIHARELSLVGDVADAAAFGQRLWCEAARRGALTAGAVVVAADGAHWIWELVEEHFPGATQIVDWYHASQYVWRVAHAAYGEGPPRARRWAKRRLADLWEGRADKVLKAFAAHRQRGQAVEEASTSFTNHQHRMRYAEYRARGLQIGSGSVESGGKQVITARLKQAGMRWSLPGARAVAALRTRRKSARWPEVLALRPPRHRTYQRQAA